MDNWNAIIEDAVLMLNDPENEYDVVQILESLNSDVIIEDENGLSPVGQALFKLKDLGEDDIARNIVFPLYQKEQEEVAVEA